ncbi:hypothetical protein N7526_001676 [Penicillium atrosanguineum]|nr:hypothetical protein N7526_001676 [Penicillium atrosanguineum]
MFDPQTALHLLESLRACTPFTLFLLLIFIYTIRTIGTVWRARKWHPLAESSDSQATDGRLNALPYPFHSITIPFKCLYVGLLTTYPTEMLLRDFVSTRKLSDSQSILFYLGGCLVPHSMVFITLFAGSKCPTATHYIFCILAIPLEATTVAASILAHATAHREDDRGNPGGGNSSEAASMETIEIISGSLRTLILLALALLPAAKLFSTRTRNMALNDEERRPTESTALLHSQERPTERFIFLGDNLQPRSSGTAKSYDRHCDKKPSTIWAKYLRDVRLLFPYLWPSDSPRHKFIAGICALLLVPSRIINVLTPMQVGVITTILTNRQGNYELPTPWFEICLYILLRFLQDNVNSLHNALWMSVEHHCTKRLTMAAFTHVHSLDLEFHLKNNTAEISTALNMGKSVIGNIERMCFQFIPMVLDLILVVSYFWVQFGTMYSFLLGITTIAYLATIRMTRKVADATRDLSDAIRNEQAIKNDSISLYESVKYYDGVSRECQRYSDAIDETNRRHYQSAVLTFLLSTCRDALMMICLLSLCMMAAYQITTGQKSVGIFASLLAYMSQLQGPLNYFAGFSLSLQRSFINSERMLELLRKRPEVIDNFDATELTYCEGNIKFTDVKFFYEEEMHILDGLDFECKTGQTVAIVGETGGGKSTIFRLLYRFYNPAEGRILVDGKDVQDITIDSLCKHIGVVPQDTVLFSDTLMYNLRYANPEASNEEIYEACRAAYIHESIQSFSNGYATKVGVRGLRLSGGEIQRIAIARLILKNPRIILLDEATAALDTNTEENVQRALANLSRGRTVLVIAHRLSTIAAANKILVLSDGKISESGTHEELLAANGGYAELWTKHSRMKEPASKLEGNYVNVDEIG